MTGYLRFMLASLVVANHVWLPTANKIGLHAVAGFFVISGYLMTMVINEVYTDLPGLARYLANRFLRIFPLYWTVCGLILIGLMIAPRVFGNLHSAIAVPPNLDIWLRNLTLINLIVSPIRLVPPAWSLTIEFAFYIAIGICLGRGRWTAVLWFGISIAYTLWLVETNARFGDRYSTVFAGSLFFSAGAVIYHYRKYLRFALPAPIWWPVLAAFAASPLIVRGLGGDSYYWGYYGSTMLFVPIFLSALSIKEGKMSAWFGDLAYPMFLLHFLALGFVRWILPVSLSPLATLEFITTYAATFAMSCAVVRWFNPAIDRLRDALRPKRNEQVLSSIRVNTCLEVSPAERNRVAL
jgi:peptidoglycan/LPS O-acetylase OafA/YrhL